MTLKSVHGPNQEYPRRYSVLRLPDRELLVFAPLYAWLSFINYAIKLRVTPAWFSTLEINHAALLNFSYTNNEQSRLLQFYIPELFHQVFGISIQPSYGLARLIFVFLTYLAFHRYLRKWFSAGEAFAGVALFAAIVPFTHMNDLQESSPLLMLLFLLALTAIRDEQMCVMLSVFFVGGLTNETMLILPSVYFFYHLRFDNLKTVFGIAGKSFLISIPLLITLVPIRYYTWDRPVLGGGFHWPDNINNIFLQMSLNPLRWPGSDYLFFILLFGVLWCYSLIAYAISPRFLRRASWMIPFFILTHLITGKINEPRQMIPLSFIIIPMAMFFILGNKKSLQSSARSRCEVEGATEEVFHHNTIPVRIALEAQAFWQLHMVVESKLALDQQYSRTAARVTQYDKQL